MPCYNGGNHSEDYIRQADSLPEKNKELNKKEALLCSACRALEGFGFDFDLNPTLSEWWADHKKKDAAREKMAAKKRLREELAARLAKKALRDLTAEEKKILKDEGYFN